MTPLDRMTDEELAKAPGASAILERDRRAQLRQPRSQVSTPPVHASQSQRTAWEQMAANGRRELAGHIPLSPGQQQDLARRRAQVERQAELAVERTRAELRQDTVRDIAANAAEGGPKLVHSRSHPGEEKDRLPLPKSQYGGA
jgi:hypothetical protein